MSQRNVDLRVFDIVPFERWNEHRKPPAMEAFNAVWMEGDNGEIYVYFGRVDRGFCQSVEIGETYHVGVTIREVYPSQDHDNPPQGWDHLPERNVVTRPQVGGYESLRIAEKREIRKRERIAKLRGE